jgi:hypothetical protein
MNKKTFYLILISFIIISLMAFLLYGFVYLDKLSCDAMGGSFSIRNNGFIQTTTCVVSTAEVIQQIERTCTMNGNPVDCSVIDEAKP